MPRRVDDELTAILEGGAGGRRPDARATRLVLDLRAAFRVTSPPAPSVELAALLDPSRLDEASARLARAEAATAVPPALPSYSRRRWVGWLTGLSLAWQVGVGSTAAFAAVGGAGVAGVLPAPAQDVFDRVVTTVMPFGRRGDEGGTPTEGRPTPGGGVIEQTVRTDDRDALAADDPDGRSRRDDRRRATEQTAPPGDDHRPGAPGASEQEGPGSEGSGVRDRVQHTEDRADEDEGEDADDATDDAEEAAEDEAEDEAEGDAEDDDADDAEDDDADDAEDDDADDADEDETEDRDDR